MLLVCYEYVIRARIKRSKQAIPGHENVIYETMVCYQCQIKSLDPLVCDDILLAFGMLALSGMLLVGYSA